MEISALYDNIFVKKLGKAFFSLVFVLFLSVIVSGVANAQLDPAFENDYKTFRANQPSNPTNTNSDVKLNTHNAVQILFIESLSAAQCILLGTDPIKTDGKCLGIDKTTGKIGYVESEGGAIALIGRLIDSTLTPPASSMQYVSYLKSNFGVAKTTHAQSPDSPDNVGLSDCYTSGTRGTGFCQIEFLLPVWKAMRNIVYLLFILLFIVIGIGIMLRVHIDPRTIMTIQNQIPKIIVGILAITFSFAIAGFLVDVMWVTVYLFASVITSVSAGQSAPTIPTAFITQAISPIDAANNMWADPNNPGTTTEYGIYDISVQVGSAFSNIIESALRGLLPGLGILAGVVGGIIDVLATLIVIIAIIVALLRLFISLIFAFINIILDIMFAPWWILAGLIPGSTMGLGSWIRDLIANLAVFPVTIAFLLLASFIMNTMINTSDSLVAFPLMGGTNSNSLAVLIGFGFILMLPNLLSTVKAVFKTPKMDFGNIMSPVSAGVGVVGGAPRRISTGVVNEVTRQKWEHGQPVEPKGWRRATRFMSGR